MATRVMFFIHGRAVFHQLGPHSPAPGSLSRNPAPMPIFSEHDCQLNPDSEPAICSADVGRKPTSIDHAKYPSPPTYS